MHNVSFDGGPSEDGINGSWYAEGSDEEGNGGSKFERHLDLDVLWKCEMSR